MTHVRHGGGALLVLGAAGSGKSTLVRDELAETLATGAPPAGLLGIVPDQAAARRLRGALALDSGGVPPLISTMHGVALRLVHQQAAMRLADPPRLVAGQDQLAIVSDILRAGRRDWPSSLREAVGTRGFAERVRDFIVRAGVAGFTPTRLMAAQGAAAWPAVAGVWREYERVLALSDSLDYVLLLRRAAEVASSGPRQPWLLIAVDGYLDFDPLQLDLLEAIRPDDCRLLAVGDPDQVVDRFRGSAADAATDFVTRHGPGAAIELLRGCYRFGPELERVRAAMAAPLPTAGLPATAARVLHAPRETGGATAVSAFSYPDPFAEAAGVAMLAQHHAAESAGPGAVPRWSDVAVVARTSAQLAVIEQALIAAGVPVADASSDRFLVEVAAVRHLSVGLRLAALKAGLPLAEPSDGDLRAAVTSGMVGCEPHDLRLLLRELRRQELASAQHPRGSAALLREEVLHPSALLQLPEHRFRAAAVLLAFSRRLARAARLVADGSDVGAVLWHLWSDQPGGPGSWASSLRRAALAAGPAAAVAHRELDAVMALFAQAQRSVARGGQQGVADFVAVLPELRFPGDRAPATARHGGALELVTAHRARNRQWPVVIVAGVQEGVWPGDAPGAGFLGEELLTGDTPVTAAVQHLADERRLFLLALTRARRQLVITSVSAGEREPSGPQPSRFLADIGLQPVRVGSRPEPGVSTPGDLVAALRRGLADPVLAPHAAQRLSALRHDPLFRHADPRTWWVGTGVTRAPGPLVPLDEPVDLTVTGLAELASCPRRWFLTRQLSAGDPDPLAAGLGRLLHRVNEAWCKGEIADGLPAAEDLVAQVWPQLPFEAPWQREHRRAEVSQALRRMWTWLEANRDRVVFAERSFSLDLELGAGERVRLRGKADLGVADSAGSLAVLDLKTAKTAPGKATVERHVQLAGYQAAVRQGALSDTVETSGAGLLLAAVPDGSRDTGPKVLWQPPAPEWFSAVVADAAGAIRREQFPARESGECRTCPVVPLCPAKNPGQEIG